MKIKPQVKVTYFFNSIESAIEAFNSVPDSIKNNNFSIKEGPGFIWELNVFIYDTEIEETECGDHIVEQGEEYPKDLIVSLHSHNN